jgi:hypothetical protein
MSTTILQEQSKSTRLKSSFMLNMHIGQNSFKPKKSFYFMHDSEHKKHMGFSVCFFFFQLCDVAEVAVICKLVHKPI